MLVVSAKLNKSLAKQTDFSCSGSMDKLAHRCETPSSIATPFVPEFPRYTNNVGTSQNISSEVPGQFEEGGTGVPREGTRKMRVLHKLHLHFHRSIGP